MDFNLQLLIWKFIPTAGSILTKTSTVVFVFFPKSDGITNKYGSLVVPGLTVMLQFIADNGAFHDNSICK